MSGMPPILLAIRDPHEHMARRRLWQRAFTTESVKEYEGTVVKRALQLVDLLASEAKKSEPVDLAKWIGYFTFDFMGDMV